MSAPFPNGPSIFGGAALAGCDDRGEDSDQGDPEHTSYDVPERR
jgi:hypothetical protein